MSLVLLFILFSTACVQPSFYHTVRSEAYALEEFSSPKNKTIFVDSSVVINDLSKLPYLRNIRSALQQKDYRLAASASESGLVLSFDIRMSRPIPHVEEQTETISGSKSTEVVTGSDGEKETIVTVQPDQEIPYFTQSLKLEKTLKLEVRTYPDNRLIWQSQARILDEEWTYAPYANTLVYEAMRSFLKTSKRLPLETRYGLFNRNRADKLFEK